MCVQGNLESYKVFYYVAKCGGITMASEKLCISQPAVSQAVKQMEHNLGVKLFVRTPKGTKLTAEGELLYRYVKEGYELIETVNPNFGYEDLPKVINSNLEIQAGTTVPIEATNKKEYVRISGYVWEDIISGKMIERNDLYQNDENDDSDKLVQGVTVELINSTTGEVVDTAVTNADGQYQFNKVRIDDIPNLYVQFRYNGMTYTTVAVHTDVANGSKALEGDARPTFNEQYAIITQGQSNNSNEEKTYDLSYERGDHASSLILGENPVYGYEFEKPKTKPVIIGNDNWISKNTTLLKGTVIGNRCIVGYGTILSHVKISDNQTVVQSNDIKIFSNSIYI